MTSQIYKNNKIYPEKTPLYPEKKLPITKNTLSLRSNGREFTPVIDSKNKPIPKLQNQINCPKNNARFEKSDSFIKLNSKNKEEPSKFQKEFEKFEDTYKLLEKIFLECCNFNKCDGKHRICVEKDNLKNKLCIQIPAFHFLIQGLIAENKKENFLEEFKKALFNKLKDFDQICCETKTCCAINLSEQIGDLNEILKLQYTQIRIRNSKSKDPRAREMNKKTMESEFNQFLANTNQFHHHNQNIKNSDLKKMGKKN